MTTIYLKLVCIVLSPVFILSTGLSQTSIASRESNERFALKLSATIGLESQNQNVIISPLLIQSALTLLYAGATDETAAALKKVLQLDTLLTQSAAVKNIAELLSSTKLQMGNRSFIANGIYVQERLTLDFKNEFKRTAQQFDTPVELLSFGKDLKAFDKINYWFLTNTNFTIGEVLASSILHDDSTFILASAVAFKAPWKKAFDKKETEKLNFHSNSNNFKLVDSMFVEHKFKYAEYAHLDAKAIELPYKDGNLKLLILLPNKIGGLAALEEKLAKEDLYALVREMNMQKVALTMPKFRVEFNADLKPYLSNLGLGDIFKSGAQFQNVFSSIFSALMPFVTHVQHKTVFEIDESGDVDVRGFSFVDLFKRQTQMIITHPFYFAIKTDDAVLLTGHIVNI